MLLPEVTFNDVLGAVSELSSKNDSTCVVRIREFLNRGTFPVIRKFKDRIDGMGITGITQEKQTAKPSDIPRLLDDGVNLFITGKAGTGKTTLIKEWISKTDKNVAVIAPTGIAALNVGGVTAHSFLGIPLDLSIEPKKLTDIHRVETIKNLDAIVIDEISMVSSILIDNISIALQKNRGSKKPFGGVQVIMVGDLHQLPPVKMKSDIQLYTELGYKSEFCFDGHVYHEMALTICELKEVYRQKYNTYLQILNHVRDGQVTKEDFEILNSRVNQPIGDNYTVLETTNNLVQSANQKEFDKLSGEKYTFNADIEGEFKKGDCITPSVLELKVGCKIMLTANQKEGVYVNGSIGKIISLSNDSIEVELENGYIHTMSRFKWENRVPTLNQETKKMESKVVGSFTQYPLKLAYAVTVHKSQGLQFDNLILGTGEFFSGGQLYVALSRCTSLKGLSLSRPLNQSDIKIDDRVANFERKKVKYCR